MKETFRDAYIAIPIKESPLLNWLKSLNKHRKFYHMTMYFLGEISEEDLENIKAVMKSDPNILKNTILEPYKLDFIGPNGNTFVAKVKSKPGMEQLRTNFESELYKFNNINLPFVPHITVRRSKDVKSNFDMAGEINQSVLNYSPTSVGVYYKVDEATALLYTQKV